MFTQILNKFLNVRNHIQNKNGVWIPQKEPTLKMTSSAKVNVVAGTDIELFNISGKKVILDHFEYTVNGSAGNTFVMLHIDGVNTSNNYEGNIFHTINSTGGGFRFPASPNRIIGDGLTYFEIMEADTTLNEYKFGLVRPIELPHGGRLSFRPNSSYVSGDAVQYKAVYRVWE